MVTRLSFSAECGLLCLALLLVLPLLLLGGCVRLMVVDVDAIATAPTDGLRCVILPLDPAVSADDLTFIAYATQTACALQTHGYTVIATAASTPAQPVSSTTSTPPSAPSGEVPDTPDTTNATPRAAVSSPFSADLADVDCAILLAFSVSGPHTEIFVSPPSMWAQRRDPRFPGRFMANRLSSTQGEISSNTYYAATLELVARTVSGYYRAPAPLHAAPHIAPVTPLVLGPQLWKLSGVLTGPDNDPRRMFPFVLAAVRPYIGKDTGGLVQVRLAPDTLEIKGVTP